MRHKQLLKDAAALIGGNVWAQAVGMLAYLLLSRLFSPEEFGVYNVFYGYVEVFIILSTCKYEMAVVRADDDREAAAVAHFALRMNAFVSFALLAVVALLLASGGMHGKGAVMGQVAWLMPALVFFCGTSRVYAAILNRWRVFKPIAGSEIITSTGGALLKIGMGLLKMLQPSWSKVIGFFGMPVGTVLGKMLGNANYAWKVKKMPLPREIGKKERMAAAKKYRNFAMFTMPKEFVSSLSYNLPLLWLAVYFDKAELGLFAFAMTVCLRPMNVLNSAFERMLYVRTMERVRNKGHIFSDIIKFVGVVSAVAFPPMLLLFVFSEPFFAFLFGGRWAGCSFYARCIIPWAFIALSSTSLSFLAAIFGRQRDEFLFFVALLVLRALALWIGIEQDNFRLAILLFSSASAALSFILLAWYLFLARRYENYL
ncbi:MAG: oligosaccharide flippase family protein [Bacteroidales bacterium]|nr:oligosaccharide flippase family protein [Bacteroidales bacterium]